MYMTEECDRIIESINDDFEGVVSKEQFEYYFGLNHLDEFALTDLGIMFYGTINSLDLPRDEKKALIISLSNCKTICEFKSLYKRISDQVITEIQIGELLGERILDLYEHTPSKKDLIERVIKEQADDDFKKEYCSGQSSIGQVVLKQFIRYLKPKKNDDLEGLSHRWKKSAGIKSISTNQITKDVFSLVDRLEKEYVINGKLYNSNSYVFSLVEAAHGFEKEYINEKGKTRLYLYFLAFAFDLRYFANKDVIAYNRTSDFEHLFLDYFADNLNDQPNREDKWFSGKAINYKNYIEIVFLYFLDYRRSDDRKTRFQKALTLLTKIKADAPKTYKPLETTGHYKKTLIELLDKDEKELTDFILRHCKITNERNDSRILIDFYANTAANTYCELTKTNKEFFLNYFHPIIDSMINIPSLGSDLTDSIQNDLLGKVLNRLGVHESMEEISFELCSNDAITRTHLLQALFYTYLRENFELERKDRCIALPVLYSDFSSRVDQTLENCGYSPINSKFILDYLVVVILHYIINNEHLFFEK